MVAEEHKAVLAAKSLWILSTDSKSFGTTDRAVFFAIYSLTRKEFSLQYHQDENGHCSSSNAVFGRSWAVPLLVSTTSTASGERLSGNQAGGSGGAEQTFFLPNPPQELFRPLNEHREPPMDKEGAKDGGFNSHSEVPSGLEKGDDGTEVDGQRPSFYITPETHIVQLSAAYNVCLSIDISPSMAVVDPCTGQVLFDRILPAVEQTLRTLVQPITVGKLYSFLPTIYVSIVAQGSGMDCFRVIGHCLLLNSETVDGVIQYFRKHIMDLEKFALENRSHGDVESELSSILQRALFVLKTLPRGSAQSIIVLTDGVCHLNDVGSYDNLMMMLNREDAPVSFVRIGGGDFVVSSPFAFLADSEMLRFAALRTKGMFYDQRRLDVAASAHGHSEMGVNLLQRTLLLRELVLDAREPYRTALLPRQQLEVLEDVWEDETIVQLKDLSDIKSWRVVDNAYSYEGRPPPIPLISSHYAAYSLTASAVAIIRSRKSEGFVFSHLQVVGRVAVVSMVLHWRPHIKVVYEMQLPLSSAGEFEDTSCSSSIKVLAFYEFLAQWNSFIQYLLKKKRHASGSNYAIARSLHIFLTELKKTDKTLSSICDYSRRVTALTGNSSQRLSSLSGDYQAGELWKILGSSGRSGWHRWFAGDRFQVVFTLRSASATGRDALDPALCQRTLTELLVKWATFSNSDYSIFVSTVSSSGKDSAKGTSNAFYVMRISWDSEYLASITLHWYVLFSWPSFWGFSFPLLEREYSCEYNAMMIPARIEEVMFLVTMTNRVWQGFVSHHTLVQHAAKHWRSICYMHCHPSLWRVLLPQSRNW